MKIGILGSCAEDWAAKQLETATQTVKLFLKEEQRKLTYKHIKDPKISKEIIVVTGDGIRGGIELETIKLAEKLGFSVEKVAADAKIFEKNERTAILERNVKIADSVDSLIVIEPMNVTDIGIKAYKHALKTGKWVQMIYIKEDC